MKKTFEERILERCKKQVDKFNKELQEFIEYTGDEKVLVDEDGVYYSISPLELVQDEKDKLWRLDCDGFLSFPIYDYYEDTDECFDNTGDDPEWGDYFKPCLNMYKKDLKRGKRWFGYSAERIDAIQDGLIEDVEE